MAIDFQARKAGAAAYDAMWDAAFGAHLQGKGKAKRALAACVADQTIAPVARGAAAAAYHAAIKEVYDAQLEAKGKGKGKAGGKDLEANEKAHGKAAAKGR